MCDTVYDAINKSNNRIRRASMTNVQTTKMLFGDSCVVYFTSMTKCLSSLKSVLLWSRQMSLTLTWIWWQMIHAGTLAQTESMWRVKDAAATPLHHILQCILHPNDTNY